MFNQINQTNTYAKDISFKDISFEDMLMKRKRYNFIRDKIKFDKQQFDKFKSQRHSTVEIMPLIRMMHHLSKIVFIVRLDNE